MVQQMDPKAVMSSPFCAFFIRSRVPKNGTPMVETIIINVKHKTMIDYLPNFSMYQFAPLRPIIAPNDDQTAIQRP